MREDTRDLLERFKAGDGAAYDVLADRYGADLRHYVLSRTDLALRRLVPPEDLVQEVHHECLKGLQGFEYRAERSFFFWQCGIARNLIRRHCHRLQRQPPSPQLSAVDDAARVSSQRILVEWMKPATSPLKAAARLQDMHLIALSLDQVSEQHREALVLRYGEELSGEEAATRLGISATAFRKRVHDGKLKVAAALRFLLGENGTANFDLT